MGLGGFGARSGYELFPTDSYPEPYPNTAKECALCKKLLSSLKVC